MEEASVEVEFARRVVGHPVVRYRAVPAQVCRSCGCKVVDGPLMIELERLADAYLETGEESPLAKLAPRAIEVDLVAGP